LYKTIFVGPLVNSSGQLDKEISLAALNWFKLVYLNYPVNKDFKSGLSIKYARTWPFGIFFSKYNKSELPANVLAIGYVNIKYLRECIITLSVYYNLFKIAFSSDIKLKIYVYNYNKLFSSFIKYFKYLFPNSEFYLLLLDVSIEKKNVYRLKSRFLNYSIVYTCSDYLRIELSRLEIDVLFFAGGVSRKLNSSKQQRNNNVFYGGKYDDYGGVGLLIDIIKFSNVGEFVWNLTGKNIHSDIIAMSRTRSDIIIHGVLKEDEYFKVMSGCFYKIIPGNSNSSSFISQFPSKIWDYISSGGIIISIDYPAFPKFIRDILIIVNDNPNSFLDAMRDIASCKSILDSDSLMIENTIKALS
jgi:hypothetical protein